MSKYDVTIDRDKFIGGSDVCVIMGLSHFKDRYTLLLEKAGLKEIEQVDNEYVKYGHDIEPLIRNYINELYKTNYEEDQFIEGDIRCNFDGINEDSILEIKSTSQIKDSINEYKYYLVQLLFYMEYAQKKNGKLVVYRRNEDFSLKFDPKRLQIFEIKFDDYKDLVEDINTAVNLFRYDKARLEHDPMLSEEDLLPVNIRELSNTIIALEDQLKGFKQLQEKQEEMKEKLRQEMNKICIKKWTMPNGTIINNVEDGEDKEVTKFNELKFKEENEELYKKYCETKIQKGRKGYLKINEK